MGGAEGTAALLAMGLGGGTVLVARQSGGQQALMHSYAAHDYMSPKVRVVGGDTGGNYGSDEKVSLAIGTH